jgi:hypothetical protein
MAPVPAYVVEYRPRFRGVRLSLIPALCMALGAGGCGQSRPSLEQRIQVYLSAPVVGAEVFLWWVDGDGHPLREDGTRHASAGLDSFTAVAGGVTDDRGSVVIDDANFVFGTFVLMARGGSSVDPCLIVEGSSTEEATLSLADRALWSVVTDYVPPDRDSMDGREPAAFVISPLTTLAWALAERRLDPRLAPSNSREGLWFETMRDSFALLGAHLGDVDLARGPLPDWLPGMPEQPDEDDGGEPLPGPGDGVTLPAFDEQARRGLILAALPSLPITTTVCLAEAPSVPAPPSGCVCLPVEPLQDRFIRSEQTGILPAGKVTQLTASCPAETIVVGGSCILPFDMTGAFFSANLTSVGYARDMAGKDVWECAWSNGSTADLSPSVVAVCLRPPLDGTAAEAEPTADRLVKVEQRDTLPAGTSFLHEATCADGDFLLRGGCTLEDPEDAPVDLSMFRSGFLPEASTRPSTWQCAWNNPSTSTPTAIATALCLKPPAAP